MYRHILFFLKYTALLGYGITCSVYDYLAWIEVLRAVVSILHLHVILQYRSSDSKVQFSLGITPKKKRHHSLHQSDSWISRM